MEEKKVGHLTPAQEEGLQREQALLESLEVVTKQMAGAVVRCSRDLRYIWANQGYANWLQRPLDEIVGHPISDVLGAATFQTLRPYFERVLTGEKVTYEQEVNYQRIGRRWISAVNTPTLDAKGIANGWVAVVVDITERKRAEEVLRRSEAQLAEAQRLARLGSWQWDPETDTVTWSEELYRMAGLDPNQPAVSYKEHSKLYTAESWERLRTAVEEALRTGTPYELDLEMVRTDGTRLWLHARGEVQRDTTGRIVQLRGTVQDITERKLAETELARVNDRLRLAMESGKSVGWDREVKSGRDFLFGDLRSIYGIPSDVFDGRVEDFRRYLHPEDGASVLGAVDEAMRAKKPYQAEFRILRPDGTVRWIAAKGKFHYSPDGEPERMLGMAVDITERKLMEESLRESEERLRLAIQAGKMYAFEWDATTDVIIRSEEVTHFPGLTGQAIRLSKQQLSASVHPEDRTIFESSIAELTPESPNTQISFRLLRPDGSVCWLQRTGRAFFDEQGRMVRMIGMVTDVTERKLAEEALSRVSGRLIEAQDQERRHIARELHDDIGQKLALLAVKLQLFTGITPDSEAQLRSRLEPLIEGISEITSDVRALSHRLHTSKLELLGLVGTMRSFCRELAEQRRVEIDFTHGDVPMFLPSQVSLCLYRVLQEGLTNAVKHSGVRHFEVHLERVSNELELTIRDPGVGFDPGMAMYTEGLGLISMRERISNVKGTISIISKPQGGTEIKVRVPVAARTEEDQMSASA
jgi:PAS domain S-box-containing protein